MIRFLKKYIYKKRKALTYQDFSVDDFLTDEFFVRWVKTNDEETAHFWDKWISNNPHKYREVMEARQLINGTVYADQRPLPDQLYTDMYEHILANSPRGEKPSDGSRLIKRIVNIAAVLVLSAGISLVYLYRPVTAPEVVEQQTPETLFRQTGFGEKLNLTLTDGTRVKLNANSRITFPRFFQGATRVVKLSGEAFFEVAEDTARPFVIQTDRFEAKVLGTSFNLNCQGQNAEVALLTGKLQVDNLNGQNVVLDPLQMATVSYTGNISTARFDPLLKTGWKDGILVFEQASFTEVVSLLEQWYGVKITSSTSLRVKGVYSGVYRNEPLSNVLQGIGSTSGFDFLIENKKVFLKPKQL